MEGSPTLAGTHAQRLVLAAGTAETRAALARWRRQPLRTLAPWTAGSLALGLLLLAAALAVAALSRPAPGAFVPVFAAPRAGLSDAARILERNVLVLALHALVCFAAYLAARALPLHARHTRGLTRAVHAHGTPVALAAIGWLAAYAFAWQAWRLGHDLASAAHTLRLTRTGLLVRLSVHAVPELTALFLPLSAALALGRARRVDDLAAAALVTTAVALPVVALAACVEVWATRLVV